MTQILVVAVFASLIISLYTGLRLFMLMERIRRESRESYEIAKRVQEDWQRFSEREKTSRRRAIERLDGLEGDIKERVEHFEEVAVGTRDRLIKLEEYLKEFFEIELRSVFDSFDKTVASILEEMKVELLRGVDRIEDIQAVVDSKSYAKDRILEGEGSVYRLVADTGEPVENPSAEQLEGDISPEVQNEEKVESEQVAHDPPRLRLEADETE